MDSNKLKVQNTIPIPKVFYADLTGAPMKQCISCECELLDGDVPYMIEKALKPYTGYDSYSTVFEYAMCMDCMESHQGKISIQSRANINQYFLSNIDLDARQQLMMDESASDVFPWINNCFVKGHNINGLGECQIYGQCIGDQMVIGEFPYMISGLALDEVVELLSPETLDEFDRLKDELIAPSAYQDLLNRGPKVLL